MFSRKEKKSSDKSSKRHDRESKRKDDSRSERSSKPPGRSKSDRPSKDASSKNDCSDKPDVYTNCWAKCLWQHHPDRSKSDREILPIPEPKQPERKFGMSEEEYQRLVSDWRKRWEYWSSITCPCKRGYFCTAHMQWVSGADVRNGAAPSKENQAPQTCHDPNQKHDGPKPLVRYAASQSKAQSSQMPPPKGSRDDLGYDDFKGDFDDDRRADPRTETQGYPLSSTGLIALSPPYASRTGLSSGSSYSGTQSYTSSDSRQTMALSTTTWSSFPSSYSTSPQIQTGQLPYQQPAPVEQPREIQAVPDSYPGAPQISAEQQQQYPLTQTGYSQSPADAPEYGRQLPTQQYSMTGGYPTAVFTSQLPLRQYPSPSGYITEPAVRGSYPSQPQSIARRAAALSEDEDDEQGSRSYQYERRQSSSQGPSSFSESKAAPLREYPSALGQNPVRRHDDENEEEEDGHNDRRQHTQTQTKTTAPRPQSDRHRNRDRDRSRK